MTSQSTYIHRSFVNFLIDLEKEFTMVTANMKMEHGLQLGQLNDQMIKHKEK